MCRLCSCMCRRGQGCIEGGGEGCCGIECAAAVSLPVVVQLLKRVVRLLQAVLHTCWVSLACLVPVMLPRAAVVWHSSCRERPGHFGV